MPASSPARDPLVLHSSRLRLALSWSTPVALTALGVYGLTERVWALTIGVTAVGLLTAVVVLLDLPLRAEFDAEGVTRVCPLRRERLPWTGIVAIERVHVRRRSFGGGSGMMGALTGAGVEEDDGPPRARPSQGLVARTGPRRVSLLTDRRESFAEFDELRALLRDEATLLRATPPPEDSTPAGRGPTALHRRRSDG